MPKEKNTLTKNDNGLKTAYEKLTIIRVAELKKFVNDDMGKKSRATLRNWLNGTAKPSKMEQQRLAEFFKVDVNTLFPQQ